MEIDLDLLLIDVSTSSFEKQYEYLFYWKTQNQSNYTVRSSSYKIYKNGQKVQLSKVCAKNRSRMD